MGRRGCGLLCRNTTAHLHPGPRRRRYGCGVLDDTDMDECSERRQHAGAKADQHPGPGLITGVGAWTDRDPDCNSDSDATEDRKRYPDPDCDPDAGTTGVQPARRKPAESDVTSLRPPRRRANTLAVFRDVAPLHPEREKDPRARVLPSRFHLRAFPPAHGVPALSGGPTRASVMV